MYARPVRPRAVLVGVSFLAWGGAMVVMEPRAEALDPPAHDAPSPAKPRENPGGPDATGDIERAAAPPPSDVVFFQYGVAFAAEGVLAPGAICDNVGIPCVLGGGGGIVVRGGWRSSGPFYFGAAYEVTKQDPNKLYRLALLQQARAEGRYYLMTARVTEPYAVAGVGLSGYGNEWAIDTWGPNASLGAGLEYQITRHTVVGLALAYRLLHFSRFTDTAGSERSPGFAQLLGLDLVLEQRDPTRTSTADHGTSP
jgi:hypothetical protein